MNSLFSHGSDASRILDAIPSMVLVVDQELRILHANRAAHEFLGPLERPLHCLLCGDALRCLNAEQAPGGCGTSKACHQCTLRNTVAEAFEGKGSLRRHAPFKLRVKGEVEKIHFSVTASPFRLQAKDLVIVTLEDVTELVALQEMLPICAACKKIRDEEQIWHSALEYLEKHPSIRFTHSLCPDCLRKYYPEEADEILGKTGLDPSR